MNGLIGSGFGLYGHLPAFLRVSPEPVYVPVRYIETFNNRIELVRFKNNIQWVRDEEAVIRKSGTIAVSLWPNGQELWAKRCLNQRNIKNIFLEKPLASSPSLSNLLFLRLLASKKNFRINYSFLYTQWYKKLRKIVMLNEVVSVKMTWSFLAHHYKHNLDNWKRFKSLGGSIINFYGIHFLAVLADLGVTEIINSTTRGDSEDDLNTWEGNFVRYGKEKYSVIINSRSLRSEFVVEVIYKDSQAALQKRLFHFTEPFSELTDPASDLDPRVKIIELLHQSIDEERNSFYYGIYALTNKLWECIETKNVFVREIH